MGETTRRALERAVSRRSGRALGFVLGACALTTYVACGGGDNSVFTPADGGDEASSSSSSGSSGSSGFGGDGGSSGSSGSSGNGDGGFDPDAACAATTTAAKRAPANILFIIDRSGSMNCNPPPTTTTAECEAFPAKADNNLPSKWEITRDALKQAIAAMPSTNSVALTYFNVDDDCGVRTNPNVPLAPISPAHVTTVNGSLDAVVPKGLTPIVGGVTLGYSHLYSQALPGKKFLVLITDGAETCAENQQDDFVANTVKNAVAVGIRTFVVGAPGSEDARAFLSQIAFNGLTPSSPTCVHAPTPANVGNCHFDLTNAGVNLATELNKALDTIAREAVGCEFDVPQPDGGTIDYNKVNVVYTPAGGQPQTVAQDTSKPCDGGADGWQYSPDKSRVVLCGPTCTAAKNDPGGSVSIALGCATQVKPR